MTEPKTHRTRSRRILTDDEIDALSNEVAETDYDVEALKTRRRGRPPMGSGPADVVPVRIDPELRAAIEARAEAEHTTTSEIIREAIRRFLKVA
ncbi:MAG: ribbon-helix-helix protein, CopG family [Acidimicrobiia bacterium]|nr:ribbon-helix-helix protein, CopG family [Acidimicrobiia bacterium]